MNDAVLQASASSRTAPATHPADEAAQPYAVVPAGRPKLVVLRGLKINAEYPIYEGRNTIGRFADKPVDIDLVSQEAIEQIWCSRQHAVITFDRGHVLVEDLNSLNGTWVNGSRIHAGQYHALKNGDVIQIGTVQLKLLFS
jgi:pSer/pThr/pTyr-binding forkhead associated (FHA) protein